ncbi:hypothetical protein PsYK624_141860 [Phanerochaete sordida]|uniref:Uncharacterized protein n=1 Tax=Phanerochaete sordida TaxID=48140 RepID=A0A9P3GPH7_9APHY|nr:hypothetical protein PsYK624_141860 [Phanerochaete sordida]
MRERAIGDALESLKKSLQPKSKAKRKQGAAEETLGRVTSYLVFLNGSTLSPDAEGKLSEVLRKHLPALYTASPQAAFELAASISKTIHEDKVIKALTTGQAAERLRWERALNALLSGVLDHLDEHQDVLSEAAGGHRANQKRLLDKGMLGGVKLGSMLWRTRDYLAMESILNLFARMIPPSGSTTTGRAERRAFIRAVFVDSNPDDAKTGAELAHMVEHVSTPDWEQTATRIVEALAASNIGYPQPFAVTEVTAGGEAKPSDRIFVDEQGFLANVLVEDDLFDSLTASYDTVTSIEISRRICAQQVPDRAAAARVVVTLSAPAKLGQKPIDARAPELLPQLTFSLAADQVGRFQTALKSRGVGNIVSVSASAKQSVLLSPAALEIDLAGSLIGKDEMVHRVDTLSQLYGTNDPSDELDEANNKPFGDSVLDEVPCINPALLTIQHPTPDNSPAKAASDVPITSSSPTVDASALGPAITKPLPAPSSAAASTAKPPPESAAAPDSKSAAAPDSKSAAAPAATRTPVSAPRSTALAPPATPVRRTASQVLRDTAFGASDDDLSSIDSPLPAPKPVKPKPKPKPKIASRPTRPTQSASTKPTDAKPASTKPAPTTKAVISKAPKAGRVLDSDDELPATPTRKTAPKAKKRIDISDDEIEDVLPSKRSLVSRTRSVLPMTPVTSGRLSSARRSALSSGVAVTKDAGPAAGNSAGKSVRKSAGDTALAKKAPVCVDIELSDSDSGDGKQVLPVDSAPRVPDDAKATLALGRDKPESKQVRMSSPPVQPAKKSVKGAMRKKNEPLPALAPAPEPEPPVREHPKRKRAAEDEPAADVPKASAAKKQKATPAELRSAPASQDSALFRPDSAKAKRRYTAKKARGASPTPVADAAADVGKDFDFDFDMIPEPGASAAKSDRSSRPRAAKVVKEAAKEVPAAAKVTRSSKKKVGKAEDTEPPAQEVVKEKAESKRKSAPRKAKEPKNKVEPVPEVEAEEPDAAPMLVVDNHVQEELPVVEEKSVPSAKKSTRMPWDNLPAKQIDAEAIRHLNPEPAPVHLVAPPLPHADDFIDNGHESVHIQQPAIENDDFDPDVTLVVSTPPKKASKELNAGFKPMVAELKDMGPDSPMEFAAPSPVPPALQVRNEVRDPIQEEPRLIRAKPQATAFRDPEFLAQRAISFVAKRPAEAPRTVSKDRKLDYVAQPPKSVHVHIVKVRAPEQPSRAEPANIVGEIAVVLQEIQEAVLHKITSKVEGVRRDVRRGRDLLLAEAAADLQDMRAESIDHYNQLIELESEYASFGRSLVHGLDDLTAANRSTHTEIQNIIQALNRQSIVKQVPTSLLPPKLPTSIQRFVS